MWYICCGTSAVAHVLWHIYCGTSIVAHLYYMLSCTAHAEFEKQHQYQQLLLNYNHKYYIMYKNNQKTYQYNSNLVINNCCYIHVMNHINPKVYDQYFIAKVMKHNYYANCTLQQLSPKIYMARLCTISYRTLENSFLQVSCGDLAMNEH